MPRYDFAGAAAANEIFIELAAPYASHNQEGRSIRLSRCGDTDRLCLSLPGPDGQPTTHESDPGVLVASEWALLTARFNAASRRYEFSRDMESVGAGITTGALLAGDVFDTVFLGGTVLSAGSAMTVARAASMWLGGVVVYDSVLSKAEMWALANMLYSGA